MKIPLSYSIRNLAVRRTTTLMTALGIAATVAVLLAVMALAEGLRSAFAATGHPLHVLVTRKGSDSELSSNFERRVFQDLLYKPGIASGSNGQPLASLEMVTVINLPAADNPDGVNVTLRGVGPAGIEMRDLAMPQGRWFESGKREAVVGKSILARFPTAQVGDTLRFGKGEWQIVGVMDGGRSAVNSEVFVDLNQAASDFDRSSVLSSALLRASDELARNALINDLETDQRLNVAARTERDYYASQMVASAPIQFLGTFVAIIMAIGSSFACMNTMYAAVARRSKEIGTLRVLGFSQWSILTAFFLESLALAAIGGLLGIVLVLPLSNVSTAIGSFVSFSEVSFNLSVTPSVMITGLIFALVMGVLGGLLPARMAARKEILNALRDI
ncbi:MAG: ABC transporter permease [Bryobacterales bacterium]|nr:ABC transporter permease [Bryobacterales bacterium]